jgi:hypothetical protein
MSKAQKKQAKMLKRKLQLANSGCVTHFYFITGRVPVVVFVVAALFICCCCCLSCIPNCAECADGHYSPTPGAAPCQPCTWRCHNDSVCDKTTGHCDRCPPGYRGDICQAGKPDIYNHNDGLNTCHLVLWTTRT